MAAPEELARVNGLGPAKIAQVKSALELGRRACQLQAEERATLRTPADVAGLVMSRMRFLSRETLRALCLNSRHQLLADVQISVGTASAAVAHPRECFREAVRRNASAVLFVHNHPSGDPAASAEDVALTRKLKAAGELLGIDLVDHVIIGDGRYESMKERGLV
jgi:DNA repair protein RadC